MKARRSWLTLGAMAVSLLVVFAYGQGRTYDRGRSASSGKREPVKGGDGLPIKLKIKELEGLDTKGYVDTPIYQSSVFGARKKDKKWVQIKTEYSTDNEWIDELTFSYYVLTQTQGKKGNVYSLYRANVTYIDIPEESEHFSTMFIRPNAVERYGDPKAIAVVISYQGSEIDSQSETSINLPDKWWESPAVLNNPKVAVTVRDGYLLNRSQSPWVYLNIDSYETIRQ